MKRSDRKAWEEEFDRRVASGKYKTDKMDNFLNPSRPTEIRVEDDAGTMRRRNGEGCCGCGKWHTETFAKDPEYTSTADHHHHGEDDGPKLFLGIF
jgi:hypothetical protein